MLPCLELGENVGASSLFAPPRSGVRRAVSLGRSCCSLVLVLLVIALFCFGPGFASAADEAATPRSDQRLYIYATVDDDNRVTRVEEFAMSPDVRRYFESHIKFEMATTTEGTIAVNGPVQVYAGECYFIYTRMLDANVTKTSVRSIYRNRQELDEGIAKIKEQRNVLEVTGDCFPGNSDPDFSFSKLEGQIIVPCNVVSFANTSGSIIKRTAKNAFEITSGGGAREIVNVKGLEEGSISQKVGEAVERSCARPVSPSGLIEEIKDWKIFKDDPEKIRQIFENKLEQYEKCVKARGEAVCKNPFHRKPDGGTGKRG